MRAPSNEEVWTWIESADSEAELRIRRLMMWQRIASNPKWHSMVVGEDPEQMGATDLEDTYNVDWPDVDPCLDALGGVLWYFGEHWPADQCQTQELPPAAKPEGNLSHPVSIAPVGIHETSSISTPVSRKCVVSDSSADTTETGASPLAGLGLKEEEGLFARSTFHNCTFSFTFKK